MNHLIPFWFIVIAILGTGFFILEGFDFGVGMLHGVVGQDEAGRRAVINTIGPLWDGNEVWLIVAGASMFAAFPGWYATMFSALYLALVLLLISLIIRGVAFEYRGKRDAARWRRTWDVLLTVGSLLSPLLLGIALGDLLHGLPINASQNFTGSFWDLLQPYAVFTGVTFVLICLQHGATFLCLKTTDGMRERSWLAAPGGGPFYRGRRDRLHHLDARHGQHGVLPQRDRTTRCARRHCRGLAGLRAPGGLRLRGQRGHHRRLRRVDLRRPVPQRDGLQHQPRVQPHRVQHRVRRVLAQGDDRGRHHLPAAGTRLPDLDVLRIPQAGQPEGNPAAGAGLRRHRPPGRLRGAERIVRRGGCAPQAGRDLIRTMHQEERYVRQG